MPFLSGLPCRLESTYRTHPPRRSRGEDIKVPGNERNIWAIINTLADWWFWGISPLFIGYLMPFHNEIWVLTLPKDMRLRYDITENDGWIGCDIGGEMHWGLWSLGSRPKSTNLINELKEHVGVAETLLDLSTVLHQRLPPAVCGFEMTNEMAAGLGAVARLQTFGAARVTYQRCLDDQRKTWWQEDMKTKSTPCSVQKATLFTMIVGYIAVIFP